MTARPLVLATLLLSLPALGACDRRDAYPPDESRTATDQVTPPGVEGGLVDSSDAQPADDRCAGLTGEALSECTSRPGGVPMILGEDRDRDRNRSEEETNRDAPARDNRAGDRNDGL
ncbi:hypothetical protein LY625_02435 [Lysobacter sp. GX 14042]|uniref:hypothetical protein n=1 Tax=Lysobacter sp. GX 14042 TaxID=2907155 RepID=UPI001F4912BA|nr:hypothetical protein [Lysobacter sp. GX 14042]MCE7031491.1 hypothetical protein [Lysobacter sp. GX 14042]